MIDPDIAMTYLSYVTERHRIWEARQQGLPGPWTDDPILRSYKFTNDFRVLDYGSQFLLTDLFHPDLPPRDTLARCFLYRYTNLPKTWRAIREELGRYPIEKDLGDNLVRLVSRYRDIGNTVFSGAYVILPQPNRPGDKVTQAVKLAGDFMAEHGDDFLAAESQEDRFRILRSLYGVGPFLAMQILTDWGYSQYGGDREDEFVVPGPGCIKGAKFIDPEADPRDTLMWAVDTVRLLPDTPLLELSHHGQPHHRMLSWMDVQNTLCEFSKYYRYADRPPREKDYRATHRNELPVLPIHW